MTPIILTSIATFTRDPDSLCSMHPRWSASIPSTPTVSLLVHGPCQVPHPHRCLSHTTTWPSQTEKAAVLSTAGPLGEHSRSYTEGNTGSQWSPEWMGVVDIGTAMPRKPMSEIHRKARPFLLGPRVIVDIVCRKMSIIAFSPLGVYSLKTAPLQRPILPRPVEPASLLSYR